ncbi:hypothetical protein FR742_33790 [Nonomuraea sp. C10]|nr:hypothetical protein FR742_33790 [Nonomuraea sp. C10]
MLSAAFGVAASTLTDNGMVFTARLAGSRNAFKHELRGGPDGRSIEAVTCVRLTRSHVKVNSSVQSRASR